ncbi:YybH family protein [Pandoraea pneumonica]|uniref:YybH family protein n=1 Tax=Pandoraea pneumonica TaxID=2508299 RepID=UPI003CF797D7
MVETYPAHGDEAAIRAINATWLDAVRNKKVGTLFTHYDPEVVLFDVMPPTEHRGIEAYRQLLENWFSHATGPIHFEVSQWQLTLAGDLAFSHSVNTVRSTGSDGQSRGATVRATVCYRKSQGRWRVVHEHASVPLAMAPC